MKIKTFIVGPVDVNCYVVSDDTGEGVVIDPGGDADVINRYIKSEKIKIKAVLNTHGHSDHIGANDEVREYTEAPLYIHEADAPMLADPRLNLSLFMGYEVRSRPAEHFLREGDTIKFGETELRVIHTPGHSAGGVCFIGDGIIFTGDTLFAGSIGRTDFPGGSEAVLMKNIVDKLMPFPDETRFFSGHGPSSTIGAERKYNPFVRWYLAR